jgi:O-antigen ligase
MKLRNRVLNSLEGPRRHKLYNEVAKHDIGIIFVYLLVFLTSPVTQRQVDTTDQNIRFSLQNAVYFIMLPFFGSYIIHILHTTHP